MSNYVEKMHLKEQAEEDIYFAKLDRALIETMHRETLEQLSGSDRKKVRKLANAYHEDRAKMAKQHLKDHRKLAKSYGKKLREIMDKIFGKAHDSEGEE